MKLGTISAVDNSNGLTLVIDGESSATTKKYHYLASYVPTAGDRVLIAEVGDSYVVMGKLVQAVADSGIVRHAQTADSATNATNATYTGRINQYANSGHYVELTYFNNNLWVRVDGSTQFALARG